MSVDPAFCTSLLGGDSLASDLTDSWANLVGEGADPTTAPVQASSLPDVAIGGVSGTIEAGIQAAVDAVNQGATGTTDTGAAATDAQAAVAGLTGTVSAVQAQVQMLTTNANPVGGRKITATATGGDSDWGSNWTITGDGTIYTDLEAFAWEAGQTGAASVDAYYNVEGLLTNDGIVGAVFLTAVPGYLGQDGPSDTLTARRNTDGTDYVFIRAFYSTIEIGYCLAGTETVWASVTATVPASGLLQLQFQGDEFQGMVNGSAVAGLAYADSAGASAMDDDHLLGGMQMAATTKLSGAQVVPAEIRQWGLQDLGASTTTYGTSARWYRASTSGVSMSRGAVEPATTNVFDTTDYCSADLALQPAGIQIFTPGLYRCTFVITLAAAINTSLAAAIVRYNSDGATIYAEWVNFNASTYGLGGSFTFNAIGDGVSEAWYAGLDVTGSGSYSVVGDGEGATTWLSIEKVA